MMRNLLRKIYAIPVSTHTDVNFVYTIFVMLSLSKHCVTECIQSIR